MEQHSFRYWTELNTDIKCTVLAYAIADRSSERGVIIARARQLSLVCQEFCTIYNSQITWIKIYELSSVRLPRFKVINTNKDIINCWRNYLVISTKGMSELVTTDGQVLLSVTKIISSRNFVLCIHRSKAELYNMNLMKFTYRKFI